MRGFGSWATVFALVLSWTNGESAVRFANNTPGAARPGLVFSSLQAAIDSSKAGDTVYVVPTPTDYGPNNQSPVLLYRKLAVFGIGFSPPQRDQSVLSRCSYLSIYVPGPGNGDTDPSGSVVSGLAMYVLNLQTTNSAGQLHDVVIEKDSIYSQIGDGGSTQSLNKITIRYNKVMFNGIQFQNAPLTSSLIYNNVLNHVILGSAASVRNIISNNIMVMGSGGATYYFIDMAGSNIICNNVFANAKQVYQRMVGGLFCNNIIYGPGTSYYPAYSSFEQNTFSNNIVAALLAPADTLMPPAGTGAGNIGSGNLNVVPQFRSGSVNATTLTIGLNDFQLAGTPASNPAFNGGTDNTDIGLSGGPYPWYSNWYATSFPIMRSLSLNSIIRIGDSLRVTIKATGQ